MFILYALVIGLVLGLLLGGRPARLGDLRFRWSWLFMAGLLVQVVLFSDAVTQRIGGLGAPIYIGSTAVVLVAVLANRRMTGMPIVALGAFSNFAAIVANAGYMPADPGALAALGIVAPTVYSNSAVVAHPVLAPMTDLFVLPTWLPYANVFSVGDVVIALGVVAVIVSAMRRPVPATADSSTPVLART